LPKTSPRKSERKNRHKRRSAISNKEREQTRGRRRGIDLHRQQGGTVIDYAIVNEAAWERVEEFKVGERVDYDHLPLEITIEGTNQEEKGKGGAEYGDNKSMG
jgi:hypothetical protein